MRLPVGVDGAIMHPSSKIIALRVNQDLQIFNLELKSKMKTATVSGTVAYWRWIDVKTVAIVTDKAVLHWSIEGNEDPKEVFARSPSDAPIQITYYKCSADRQWMMLGGITQASGGGGIAGVAGALQVYSAGLKQSQPTLDSHAACFASHKFDHRAGPSTIFCFTKVVDGTPKLNMIEIGVPPDQGPFKQSVAIQLAQGDFPLALITDNAHGTLYMISKGGVLCMFELLSGKMIFANKASQSMMFANVEYEGKEAGFVSVDQKGRVAHFFVDEAAIVPYIVNTLNDADLGMSMAARYNLPGADGFFKQQFQRLMAQGDHGGAINLAASSPQGILRTIETINALKQTPNGAGLLQYFKMLLSKGKLNAIESIELCRPVLNKGAPEALEKVTGWIKDQQLEPSEELGDLLQRFSVPLALSVYLRANCPEKVISCFLSLAAQEQDQAKALDFLNKIPAYARQANFAPEYNTLISQLIRVNGERAKDFALILINDPNGSRLDVNAVSDLFYSHSDIKNATNILLEYLKNRGDRPEDALLQTKLFEIPLRHAPAVAEVMFDSKDYTFTHYDRLKIAQLCEAAQLLRRALEHYTDLGDIKRVLASAASYNSVNPEFLIEFFGRLNPDDAVDCLRDMLKFNLQANIRLVVEVAKRWSDYLNPDTLISLFEDFKSFNGLYFYLNSLVNTSDRPSVVFKYIEAAVKLQQFKEIERVCQTLSNFDPKEVKDFLIQQNLKDPRPLIYVCDRFGFVEELTQFLYNNKMVAFIEAYVQRMNSLATPAVVGALLDLNCPDEQIKKMVAPVRGPPDAAEFIRDLCEACEKRNRSKIMRQYLEERLSENTSDVHVHNGLAKIYVDVNNNPNGFLTTNKFYDSLVVGKYCESRDPHLSFVAYRRANGSCDDELIAICNEHGFYKDLARYLVEVPADWDQARYEAARPALWAKVLDEGNAHRRQLIDQVVATALPEARKPEEVSVTVKAFMAANMPNELIELLERIVLHGPQEGEFAQNKHLQNLLILTAIKTDKSRVMEYLKRLENFDGPELAKVCVTDKYELFEEAFFIYKKFKKGPDAITVLLENLQSIPRAVEFAEYWDQPEVWSLLGKAQLHETMVREAIASFLKAVDPSMFLEVIAAARAEGFFTELTLFIQMARTKLKDSSLDNELIYCFAKTDRLSDLEDFITQPNSAKIGDVGDICFGEKLYQAARILFNHINNNAKLAICLVKLELFQEAVDAARKANAIPTWKAVCFACVDFEKFRLAQMCAVNVIVYMEHLLEVVKYYETRGHFEEIISVLEQGINLDRAHQGIYTQLAICYCKYKEEKVMEHVKLFYQRLNVPLVLGECQRNQHWSEAVFLYSHYDQYDNAVDVLINHSAECWTHELFKEVLSHVTNNELYYRAIDFYLNEHPLLLNDLLLNLAERTLDHNRVVAKFKFNNNISLIVKYLLHVQRSDLATVNEAINALYVEEENFAGLRESIDNFKTFDQVALAKQLENHEVLEFRRISAVVYKHNKRFDRSMELSKKDGMWGDAMETAAESKDATLAERLLMFFVEKQMKEAVTAHLYACYELIRPDAVMEIAWRYNLMHFAMPYMIQTVKDMGDKLDLLSSRIENNEKKAEEKEIKKEEGVSADQASFAPMPMMAPGMGMGMPMPMLAPGMGMMNAPLALMPAGSNAGGYGGGMGY
jgi:clathrin heavy chain